VSAEYLGGLDLTNSSLFEEERIAEAEAGILMPQRIFLVVILC
jgi:hypothetical protein